MAFQSIGVMKYDGVSVVLSYEPSESTHIRALWYPWDLRSGRGWTQSPASMPFCGRVRFRAQKGHPGPGAWAYKKVGRGPRGSADFDLG